MMVCKPSLSDVVFSREGGEGTGEKPKAVNRGNRNAFIGVEFEFFEGNQP